MSLEDEVTDVVAKAMMGLGMDAGALSDKAGIGVAEIDGILRGEFNGDILRKIATPLGLDPGALAALPGYLPAKQEIPGIRRIELPFGKWTVNAWLVEAGGCRILFDAGFGTDDIMHSLDAGMPDTVLITHSHEDHVGGIAALESAGVRVISETDALAEGTFSFGPMTLRVLDLSGHKTPTAGYLIEGLGKRLLVAGDAIFSGSIGRCRSADAYRTALANLRRVLAEAGTDCVILPGHGPATTVAEEFSSNPFHPGFH
jgi:hydroxyacylglutathione hydrolase